MTGARDSAGVHGPGEGTHTPAELITDLQHAGATQNHIARILNVDPALITRWKNGDTKPGSLRHAMLQHLHEQITAW